MSEDILIEEKNSVLEITFNRPEKKNALTNAMYGKMADALDRAQDDHDMRAVLIAGADGVFSAGNDIQDFARIAAGGMPPEDMQVLRMLKCLSAFNKPVIAAVEGLAIGVGTTLLLHCDLAYAADDAKLSTPFVDLALVPEAASSLLLPKTIGYKRAYAMFCLGEALSGMQAEDAGLVNKALPSDKVMDCARGAAQHLATKAAGALSATKALMRNTKIIDGQMDEEARIFAERLKSPEAREAFAAFIEKRTPDFRKAGTSQ